MCSVNVNMRIIVCNTVGSNMCVRFPPVDFCLSCVCGRACVSSFDVDVLDFLCSLCTNSLSILAHDAC